VSAKRHLHLAPQAEQRIWRIIDPATGEHEDFAGCPHCEEKEAVVVQLERQIRTLNARLTRLQRDEEKEARKHAMWAEASALHDWWALATGHEGTKFGADELYAAVPRLKEHTAREILQGIAGIAFDPNTKRKRNGHTERYDGWETLMKSGPKFQRYAERAPGWPVKQHYWKRWLIDRIESNLRTKEEK
jgi:hypothetical protein